jgi:large conductance mechanosensitive channel
MKKFFDEFKQFALKGNVIELAVAVVIGGAFGKIVSSLVDDIITPAILQPVMTAAHIQDLKELVIPGTAIKYGNFLSNIITFVIIAFALFLLIRIINKFQKKEEQKPAAPAQPTTEQLLAEIRDILKSQQ